MKKNNRLISVLLSAILLLAGCSNIEKGRDAIIGTDVNKVGIIHVTGDEMVQWTVSGDEIDALREWASGLKFLPHEFEKNKTPYDTDTDVESYEFYLTKGDYRNISYAIIDEKTSYIFYADKWYTVTNPSVPPLQEPAELTLDKVIELAGKGDDLTWSDFEQYKSKEIGSGLYILHYNIDENYYLLVGGTPDKKPTYIRLVSAQDDTKYIDIRTESIKDFISK